MVYARRAHAFTYGCIKVFSTWEKEEKAFCDMAKDLNKRRKGEKFPSKLGLEHMPLQVCTCSPDAYTCAPKRMHGHLHAL